MLKILQTSWITSLAGINFKKARKLNGKNQFQSELFNSSDFDVKEITGILADFDFAKKYAQIDAKKEAIRSFVKNKYPVPKTFSNLPVRKPILPKNSEQKQKKLSELKTADPNNYHPKDFYARPDSHQVESESKCEKLGSLEKHNSKCAKPKPAKVYSSYKKKTVSDFEYRDYSFGDFRQNQNKLSKKCDKKLLSLNLPVFVEDGSATAIVGKDYLCE